jgi:hypothetical protein
MPLPGASLAELVGGGPGDAGSDRVGRGPGGDPEGVVRRRGGEGAGVDAAGDRVSAEIRQHEANIQKWIAVLDPYMSRQPKSAGWRFGNRAGTSWWCRRRPSSAVRAACSTWRHRTKSGRATSSALPTRITWFPACRLRRMCRPCGSLPGIPQGVLDRMANCAAASESDHAEIGNQSAHTGTSVRSQSAAELEPA